jgi:hypothetical protein
MMYATSLYRIGSSFLVISTMAIAAPKSLAQTPTPTPTSAKITAIQAPNADTSKSIFQSAPQGRAKFLPEGIIQFSGVGNFEFTNPQSKANHITLDIPNAVLKDQKLLELQQPYPGIAQVTIAPLNSTTAQLTIVGAKALPTVSWSPFDGKLILLGSYLF